MSIFRQPYEKHSYRGALDSSLTYYLLQKYSVRNQLWLEQFYGGEGPSKVAGQLGLRWRIVDLNKGQGARQLEWVDGEFDGILSHPPYWNATAYSEDPKDLCNCRTYKEFITELNKTLVEAERVLQPGGYLIVVIGDVRRDKVLHPVHSDVIQFCKKFKVLTLRDVVVWELSSTGTSFLGSEWMIMMNYCLVWEKLGYESGGL